MSKREPLNRCVGVVDQNNVENVFSHDSLRFHFVFQSDNSSAQQPLMVSPGSALASAPSSSRPASVSPALPLQPISMGTMRKDICDIVSVLDQMELRLSACQTSFYCRILNERESFEQFWYTEIRQAAHSP